MLSLFITNNDNNNNSNSNTPRDPPAGGPVIGGIY